MKKVFLFLATAVLAVAACNKPQYIIPVDDNTGQDDPEPQEGFVETTLTVDIVMQEGVNNNYSGVLGVMPGEKILEALDMTANEFYTAMGTYSGSGAQTSQEKNTILFGVANANNTEDFKWVPSSTNNFGHWFGKNGELVAWGDEAYFFMESRCEWGLDAPDAETLAALWDFTVGCFPERTVAGESYKATQVFLYIDDDDVEHYVYVVWNITVEEAEEVSLNVVGTQEVNYESPFYGDYTSTPLYTEIDTDALQAAIGIPLEDADVYGINADGSASLAPGTNFWFTAEGNITKWGEGAGICINDDAGDNTWSWCMFPDEALSGQTLKGAVAFVNPTDNRAYVVYVTVVITAIDYLSFNVLVSYETGESVYTLTENNIAAIADALGEETIDLATIGTDIAMKGVNSDGSIYDGGYTANNGYWYSSKGDVTNWGSDDFNTYIEYRGEGNFGCGLWEETGVTNTVQLALVKGDKQAVLTFNLEVDEQKSYQTEEIGTLTLNATQKLSDGYGGEVLVVDYEDLCTKLGLSDETFAEKFIVITEEGTMDYTGEAPGFWFNADGVICNWADDGSSFYLNVKYGENLPEGATSKLIINTGIRAEENHVTAAGTFTGKMRFANIETLKHVTVTVTVTVTTD